MTDFNSKIVIFFIIKSLPRITDMSITTKLLVSSKNIADIKMLPKPRSSEAVNTGAA